MKKNRISLAVLALSFFGARLIAGVAEDQLFAEAIYGDMERVKYWIEKGADVNARDKSDLTPLHWAARMDRQNVAYLLVKSGADPFIKNKKEKTPLDYAKDEEFKKKLKEEWRLRRARIGKYMLEKGVPPEIIKKEILKLVP